jgi:hypothetical protein
MGLTAGAWKESSMNGPLSRPPATTSLTFRLRLAKAIGELEGACRLASEHSWSPADRARVVEISAALGEACRLEGMRHSAVLARSLVSLFMLSREQILPIEEPFREKVADVLGSLRGMAEGVLLGYGT